ncbi:MAG: NADH-quinone oxidoreductase subunit B family protein [Candidatus Hodarchaeales archaeon]|jgi:coenzyme F420-reducing hydrogenase gamma subunit
MVKKDKLRVGIFGLTSCYGCQLQILNLEETILPLLNHVDITYWRLAQEEPADQTNLDIAIIEGSVSNNEEIEELKEIRKNSKMVVALGACACLGGVQSMRNLMNNDRVKKAAYSDLSGIREIKVKTIEEIVEVDFMIRGCPINKSEFADVVYSLIVGRSPHVWKVPVCNECKIAHNECFFEREKPTVCLGPIIEAGCGARCPSNGCECDGCRGPTTDLHIAQQVKEMKSRGMYLGDIALMIRRYSGTDKYNEIMKV